MKKSVSLAVASIVYVTSLYAQPLNKAATDAFLLTRMIQKFHVQPRPLNDELSNDFFNQVLKQLDDDRIFFIGEDISKLQPYRFLLDDQVRVKKTDYLQSITALYQLRLSQADSMVDNICKSPFNFAVPEKFSVSEDTSYPADITAMRNKLNKHLRLSALESLLDEGDEITALSSTRQKKALDSLEIIVRKKVQALFKRSIRSMQQVPGGLPQSVADIYCKSLALCYDPHTEYFPPAEKENFESMIGGAQFQFGFRVDESKDEGVEIDNLKPGSPAYKSGMLNKGDKLQSLQWEGQKAIDVSDASAQEISQILSASNHDKLQISVKKADGTSRQVTLQKEKTTDAEDDNRVRSFLLKGTKTIGYISLPAFYTDWSEDGLEEDGCANDVAKEIVKLKKEKIDGLIVDVRYNGGGSMQEAIQLSGIFIDAGPVGQIKTNEAKVYSLKDINSGTIYDGPLILMVNGYSASASEMIAGTLQDYHRALIVGTPTYGKATAQVVLPLDTTFKPGEKPITKPTSSYIKVTTDRLYRVNGTTAQGKGVQPDVVVPDMSMADNRREANETNTLSAPAIDANKYYKPYPIISIAGLNSFAESKLAASDYFKAVIRAIEVYKQTHGARDVSLSWADALKEKNDIEKALALPEKSKSISTAEYTITNNAYENQRLASDKDLQQINAELKMYLAEDPQLKIAYELAVQMIK